jgi:carbamoyltransferase
MNTGQISSHRLPTTAAGRAGPRHPLLGSIGFRATLPIAEYLFRKKHIHRATSQHAAAQQRELARKLAGGEKAYLIGINIGGFHNTGVALVEVTREGGPRIICNNEEERFSGLKHTNVYPRASLEALAETMDRLDIRAADVVAWLTTYDYPLLAAAGARTVLEEFPYSLLLLGQDHSPTFGTQQFRDGIRAPARLGRRFGFKRPVPLISMPHHDNHAWFSYWVSPFALEPRPVMVAVIDGSGDFGAISLYIGRNGKLCRVRCNGSLFDSLGLLYGILSSTQGGWTTLSSEGRYMGAAAYGNSDRSTNRFYLQLRDIFCLQPDGEIYLNRSLASWPRYMLRKPYTEELVRILGAPIRPEDMWNPDAVLRLEDIRHRPNTQERLDKAAATQMVFEDALVHIIDFLIRSTGSDRLVLTGGAALNAVANMRLLEHFDTDYYHRVLKTSTRLHLWVPPVSGDAGVTVGAPYAFGAAIGLRVGSPLEHAFFCGSAPTSREIVSALKAAPDVAWLCLGNALYRHELSAIVDLMAYITARDGVIALFQGPAETGPRALGHRSILANPCNPCTRALLNERVKHREAIRPLAPMATLFAAKLFFELNEGASDNEYNAYNYMILTVRAKTQARLQIPAVIHVDGTARLQLVREQTDAIAYAYLKALGKRIGVEIAVNTSFNVAGPIAQSAVQALNTLRRAHALDGLFMFSQEGPAYLAWTKATKHLVSSRVQQWLAEWRLETSAAT